MSEEATQPTTLEPFSMIVNLIDATKKLVEVAPQSVERERASLAAEEVFTYIKQHGKK